MEETISLKEIFGILKKHISSILISMFVGLGLAGFVTFFVMTPQYSSRAQLIVAQTQNENSANNLNDVNSLASHETFLFHKTSIFSFDTTKNPL